MLLAGTGAFLRSTRGVGRSEAARFLITRGVWLIVLELTVVRWGWTFTTELGISSAQVIWAIGWSMIALAGLIYLPVWLLIAFSFILIAGHNAVDGVDPTSMGVLRPIWMLLHAPGLINVAPGMTFHVYYPLVPWVAVMSSGYLFGKILTFSDPFRRKWLTLLGGGLIVLFVILRASNIYGEPKPWESQPEVVFTIFSFLNCEKYPPSLLFLLMTLGPGISLLAVPAGRWGRIGRICSVYGRAPLIFYLLHIPLIHGLAMLFAVVWSEDSSFLVGNQWLIAPEKYPALWGFDLWVVYGVWIGVMIILYPVCFWFGKLKQRKKHWWWLSYL